MRRGGRAGLWPRVATAAISCSLNLVQPEPSGTPFCTDSARRLRTSGANRRAGGSGAFPNDPPRPQVRLDFANPPRLDFTNMQRSTGPVDPSGSGNSVHDHRWYSLVLASDYRVDDIERMWSTITQHRAQLCDLGAHHVVLYASITEPDRVLVTVGLRNYRPINELLRSPLFFEWFDMAGVNDIPAIFAGRMVEKIDLTPNEQNTSPSGVVIGAVSAVGDVDELMGKLHDGRDRFSRAGVHKLWIYRAVDDGNEILTLLQVDSAETARRWVDRPDPAAEWMPSLATTDGISRSVDARDETPPGTGAYPSVFIGQLANIMRTEATR